MTGDPKPPAKDIAIIILAAGSSSRLGNPKQLAKYRGQTLISRAVQSAFGASLGPVIVVTSPEMSEAVREEISDSEIELVFNAESHTGMSSSIRAGLAYARRNFPNLAAVILALGDQPLVNSDTFARLAAEFRGEGKSIVASAYSETLGVPALFDRSMFDELLALKGDRGAKSVILSQKDEVACVPAPEAAFDIDSAADLDSLK